MWYERGASWLARSPLFGWFKEEQNRMTLIIAFKCQAEGPGEGIQVTADRRASGVVAIDVEKIVSIVHESEKNDEPQLCLALASGAGRAGLVRQLIRIAELTLLNQVTTEWDETEPSFSQFEDAMMIVQDEFMDRISKWKRKGVESWASILICGLDGDGRASMYEFDQDGIACPVHDSPGYACLGSGFVTGGNLILKQFWNPDLNSDWGLALSAYIIDMVSSIDPGVGSFDGSSYFFRLVDERPSFGELIVDSIESTLEDVRQRKEILKLCWDLCDVMGEEGVSKKLEQLRKKLTKSS